ncbi:MAG TPA: NYN domain-containing protein, partial [Candidatus Dormibacteraeota bacterium]|nr:NYN domain-containing protein [Candidatus Dormibacteraeota bacterium]
EPIHAPSKISGGRRQSSADMHMVIDMFLEAIDHEDIDTFVLMTGDADFVRMVATLRRRFGRRVIISGVQSTSTSLDLMNAADARDPITRQDVDLTGELGPMTRPLVTRADLEAQAEAAVEAPQKGRGGLFGGLFRRKSPQGASPQAGRPATSAPAPAAPPTPLAPRRMRASELRSSSGTARGGAGSRSQGAGTAQAEPAPSRRAAASSRGTGSSRGRQAEEMPAVTPGTEPDEVERSIIREIHLMPPGRMGYATIKTIEETLRSKAGAMGATRKEIPTRLQRLEAMGIFKRSTRPRGSGEVETGELVTDHPTVTALTSGLEKPTAKEPRSPRAPRRERGSRLVSAEGAEAVPSATAEGPIAEAAVTPQAEAKDDVKPEREAAAARPVAASRTSVEVQPAVEPEAASDGAQDEPFRWVSGGAAADSPSTTNETDQVAGAEEKTPAARPARKTPAKKPAGTTRRKAATPRSKKKEQAVPEGTTTADSAGATEPAPGDPPPG